MVDNQEAREFTGPEEWAKLFIVPRCWVIQNGLHPVWVRWYSGPIDAVAQQFFFVATKGTLNCIYDKSNLRKIPYADVETSEMLLKILWVYEEVIIVNHDEPLRPITQC